MFLAREKKVDVWYKKKCFISFSMSFIWKKRTGSTLHPTCISEKLFVQWDILCKLGAYQTCSVVGKQSSMWTGGSGERCDTFPCPNLKNRKNKSPISPPLFFFFLNQSCTQHCMHPKRPSGAECFWVLVLGLFLFVVSANPHLQLFLKPSYSSKHRNVVWAEFRRCNDYYLYRSLFAMCLFVATRRNWGILSQFFHVEFDVPCCFWTCCATRRAGSLLQGLFFTWF